MTGPMAFRPDYRDQTKPVAITDAEREAIRRAFTASGGVFGLLSTLRTRRVGLGYRYETGEPETFNWSHNQEVAQLKGPLSFESARKPVPLSELEEALIAWAAAGPNGVALADVPVQGALSSIANWAGRTIPSVGNDASVDLFIVNDSGVYLYRPALERLSTVEIRSEEDYWKILKWYREDRQKIADRRLDVGWGSAPEGSRNINMMGPHQYNANRPGSTWFLPVGDLGFSWVNYLFTLYEWAGVYLMDPDTGKATGCDDWVKPGFLEVGLTVPAYEELVVMMHANQVGCAVQNMRLASEALGLGAWPFSGYVDDLILGAFPDVAKGLGFEFLERDVDTNPTGAFTSTGLPGVKEAVVAPSKQFPTADDMVRYVADVRYARGGPLSQEDNWAVRNGGPYGPETVQRILEEPRANIPDWVLEAVRDTARYIIDKYGCAPAFTNPIQANFSCQVHHLDLDFYRRYGTAADDGRPFAVTPQIEEHFRTWHPDQPDPYAG